MFTLGRVSLASLPDSQVFMGEEDAIRIEVLGTAMDCEGVSFTRFKKVLGWELFVIRVEVAGPAPRVFVASIHFGGFLQHLKRSFAALLEVPFQGDKAVVGDVDAFGFESFPGSKSELVNTAFIDRELIFERGNRWTIGWLVPRELKVAFAFEIGDVSLLNPLV